jgi:phasin family protein
LLNIQTAKTAVAEQRALADAALSAHSLSEVIDLQSRQLPAAVKKSSAYSRHVEDIAVQMGTGLFIAMQEHIGRSLRMLWETVDFSAGAGAAQRRLEKSGKVIASDDAQGDPH